MPKDPIAITGMHRSGTSMVTRALHSSGLHLVGSHADELIDAAADNPEGFWESKAIVACNDALLEAAGGAWDHPPALPPQAVDDPRLTHIAEAATGAIAALREHDRWGFKDPRLCLTAGYWLDLEPDLKFIICVRHPLEVALSLKRRNQNSYSLGLALWERYYTSVLDLVPPERRIVTHYDTFFLDPVGELGRLCAFAELDPGPPVVSSELRHHSINVSLGDAGTSRGLQSLYADLCREAGVAIPIEPPTDEGRVRRLVLDGAVARRHADQRQEAIERLQERELELRARLQELEVARSDAVHLVRYVAQRAFRRLVMRPGQRVLVRLGRSKPQARQATTALPRAETQGSQRGAGSALRKARKVARGAGKRAARRLPTSVQQRLRIAAGRVPRGIRRGDLTSLVDEPSAPPRAPRGPALRHWKAAYERMVSAAVGNDQPWLVITPGSPRAVLHAHSPGARPFPGGRADPPSTDGLAYVARLEGLRWSGHRFLVLPEGSRPWFQQEVILRDHVSGTYRAIVDEPGAGAVFDLLQSPVTPTSLRSQVTRLTTGLADPPAVLNLTSQDLAPELPELAIFRPPGEGPLPYLDHSVDLVIVDGQQDLDEARRVAARGVIVMAPGGAQVLEERSASDLPDPSPRVLLWSYSGPDATWEARLAERATPAGAEVQLSPPGDAPRLDPDRHDIVVFVEPHVLPLPGAIETAARLVLARPEEALAGKILRHDGRLDAAGGMVFSDRSVAAIASGSRAISSPWHDYARPVCWAPGLIAFAPSLLRATPLPGGLAAQELLREWCAELWAHGVPVVYQPSVVAVRVTDPDIDGSVVPASSSWQRVLDFRPSRPSDLSDGAWRYLLAHDDVEACRG